MKTALVVFKLLLALTTLFSRFLDEKRLKEAEARGEDTGAAREFLAWQEALNARAEKAKRAGDDVASGRVRIDSENDPFNRSRGEGKGDP